MTKEETLLLELVQVGLGVKNELGHNPSFEEWSRLFDISKIQTVAGVAFDGIQRIGEKGCKPPFELLMEWIGLSEIIKSQYELHQEVLKKIQTCLNGHNINVAFMKGLVVGNRYPYPRSRQCGDIDFVVSEKDFEKTLDVLDTIGQVDRSLIHEHHGMAFVDGVTLEPHFKVHNFQNPKVDEAMTELFREIFPEHMSFETIEGVDTPIFPAEYELIVLVGHMVNHVYAEGLGLRQVIDFMMFMDKKYPDIDKEKFFGNLKRVKMERAFRIFTCICERHLGLSKNIAELDYSEKECKFADKLMDNIMTVGNFGRAKRNVGHNFLMRPIKSYLWVVRRSLDFVYLCPAEARWWPISKFRRYFLLKKFHKFEKCSTNTCD